MSLVLKRLFLAALIMLSWSSLGMADYVFYHAKQGDWTLSCAKSHMTGERYCNLVAPPPGTSNAANFSELSVTITEQGRQQLKLSVRGVIPRPLAAAIHLNDLAFRTPLSFHGEGAWPDDAAAPVLKAMGAAKTAVVVIGTGTTRHEVAIEGLTPALETAKAQLRNL